MSASPRELVLNAHQALWVRHEPQALSRYFSDDYLEHSSWLTEGWSDWRRLVEARPLMRHEVFRVLVDGDRVVIHGRYSGVLEEPMIGFDLYLVEDGEIVEHWDALVPEAPPNASGRHQFDGPSAPDLSYDTEASRALVVDFFNQTLLAGDAGGFRRFTDGQTLLQHSPEIADGVEAVIGFLNLMEQQGLGLHYSRLHHVLAEGDWVLTHSEGEIAGERQVFMELWRVENSQVVELWDAICTVPMDEEPFGQRYF